jgi:DNA polymerase III subunit delta
MKVAARDIDSFLRAPDQKAHAVLIYGPDSGLVHERAKRIAAYILGAKPDPMNKIELTADQLKSDPARLRDELCSLSLMGGRRVVMVQGANEKLTPIISDALTGTIPTCYLIVEGEELSSTSSLRALFERDETLAALPCYRDEGRNLEDIIRAALQSSGLTISRDALHYLAANLGNDRGVTQSELAKIALYMDDEKEVTLPIVLALTDYNAAETIEDMCYFVACGDLPQSQALLARLLHEGIQPVVIVRALLRHFQRIELLRAQIDAGTPLDDAVAALRPAVFFKYVPKMKRALTLWRGRTLSSVLDSLIRTERELKSSAASPALIIGHATQHMARLACI